MNPFTSFQDPSASGPSTVDSGYVVANSRDALFSAYQDPGASGPALGHGDSQTSGITFLTAASDVELFVCSQDPSATTAHYGPKRHGA